MLPPSLAFANSIFSRTYCHTHHNGTLPPPTPSSNIISKIQCPSHDPGCCVLSCHIVAAIREGANRHSPHSTPQRQRRPKRIRKDNETFQETSVSEKQPISVARSVQFPGGEQGGTAANTIREFCIQGRYKSLANMRIRRVRL
jgi:hypothetical protein